MRSKTLADANDLDAWASQITAEVQFARLLRRLIHFTGTGVRRLAFRADEGVRIGGWDGIVVAEDGNEFVPTGTSAWEMGTSQKVKAKADADYEKRSAEPGDVDPANATYVFATPRRWGGKERWIKARQAEGRWREVRAYDADDLETWLEFATPVHLWISTLLGKRPEGASDLENWWQDWSAATDPPLSASLMISGRAEAAERILRWLQDTPSTVAVQADSREEALAFVAAVIDELPADERVSYLARAAVAYDPPAWNQLSASGEPLLLAPMFGEREMVASAVRRGHHVVVALGRGDVHAPDTIEVPRLRRDDARAALLEMGLLEDRADEMATLARRSLLSLRRRLAILPQVQSPSWVTPANAASLLPAVLAGSWNDAAEGDRNLLARLARTPYKAVIRTLVRWANESDPPVRRVGEIWYLVSKEDAWSLLSRFFTPDDLSVFEAAVLDVFGEVDPQYDLPVGERYLAGVLGISSVYSGRVRNSLAETLALMGAQSNSIRFVDGSLGQDRANRVVRQLLARANADWRNWASLSFALPSLAEAAPEVFLDAAERGLTGDDPVLPKLFQDGGDVTFFNSSPHTGLLWALETIAWKPEHLGRAAIVLARLARSDPGGRTVNRPINSLCGIFGFWRPQTAAGVEQRLNVLDAIRQRVPEVSWQFLRHLLPGRHGALPHNAAPRWREWVPAEQPNPTLAELFRATDEIVHRLLEEVGENGSRWASLIGSLEILTRESFDAVLEGLRRIRPTGLQPEDRRTVWSALRHAISHHRSCPDAEWALPAELVDRLEPLYQRFTPNDAIALHTWVFAEEPDLLDPKGDDFEAQARAVARARRKAARELYREGGVAMIEQAADRSESPFDLGSTVGSEGLLAEEEDEFLTRNLAAAEVSRARLAQGFVIGRSASRGWKWVDDKLARTSDLGWNAAQLAEFFTFLPFGAETWNRVEMVDAQIQQLYWSRVAPYAVAGPAEAIRASERLLKSGRPYAATRLLAYNLRKGHQAIPLRLVVRALQQALRGDPLQEGGLGSVAAAIGKLMDFVQSSGEVNDDTMAQLEWGFLPLFRSRSRSPRLLHRALSRSPDLFAELLTLVYRGEGELDVELSDDVTARAQVGHDLLESWRSVPGLRDDGTVEGEELRIWVMRAREAANQCGRGTVAIREIGKLLKYAPSDPNGTWPTLPVRELIEELASDDLEDALETEVYNSRGLTMRSPTSGGGPERALMEQYVGYASLVSDRWPRTATMLRRIADTYRRHAAHEDVSAQLTEDFWR